MNAKKCKKLRRMLNKGGVERAKLVIIYAGDSLIPWKRFPTAFKYPFGSFQRIYKDAKK
jgi:hypothetical protein